MAKKTTSTAQPAAPVKPAAPTKSAAPAPPPVVATTAPAKAVAPKPTAPTKRAVKPATKSAKSKPTAKAPAAKPKTPKKPAATAKPSYTRHDVALRAYYIAEKRVAHGLPGGEHHDWIEAERQLAAESSQPKKAKKV